MSGPLIPYITLPELPLPFLDFLGFENTPSIKPFGTLVAIGVYVGSWLTMRRARERGLDTQKLSDFIFYVVAIGFVISHVFDAITYHPETVKADPLYLLKVWDGLSSFGGFLGASIGALVWKKRKGENILEFVDVCVSAFPLAWVFGRTGCSVVHDHPGALSNAWFAVKYPADRLQEGFAGRYDLGLIEMVLTVPLAIACSVLWRREPFRPHGFYIALTLTAYAPVRFLLDFLRVQPDDRVFGGAVDNRYGGLTPAQWMCFVALALGLYYLNKIRGAEYVPNAPLDPELEKEVGDEEQDEDPSEDEEDAEAKEPRAKTKTKEKKRSKKGQADDDEAEGDEEMDPSTA
ncbi:MAG: prolipoprotein diacylglyceryl transferase family protein [Myxococcota bacterium]